jgi:hypothetical protein
MRTPPWGDDGWAGGGGPLGGALGGGGLIPARFAFADAKEPLIVLLLIQGVLGVLQSKRIGNVKRWQELHEKLPYALFLVLIAHIIFNNFGY